MPYEITNAMRGSSIVRAVDPGTYTITLNSLRSNTTTENVTAAHIKRVLWSTNGNISAVRNSVPILALHGTGEMKFDEMGHTVANNSTESIVVTVTTGGSIVLELSKVASYNVDPYTGETL